MFPRRRLFTPASSSSNDRSNIALDSDSEDEDNSFRLFGVSSVATPVALSPSLRDRSVAWTPVVSANNSYDSLVSSSARSSQGASARLRVLSADRRVWQATEKTLRAKVHELTQKLDTVSRAQTRQETQHAAQASALQHCLNELKVQAQEEQDAAQAREQQLELEVARLSDTVASKSRVIDELQNDMDALRDTKDRSVAACDELEQHVDQLQTLLSTTKREHQAEVMRLREEERARVKAQQVTADADRRSLEEQINSLNERVAALQARAEASMERQNAMQAELEEQQSLVAQRERELAEARARQSSTQTDLQGCITHISFCVASAVLVTGRGVF